MMQKRAAWLDPFIVLIEKKLMSLHKLVVAIDGRCGSGKTTAARILSQHFDCTVFHMDDFYLPFEQRTPERMSIPGNSIDHHRFLIEILEPWTEARPVVVRKYDCSRGILSDGQEEPWKHLAIVEGSYSLYPSLQPYYDLTCFIDCDPQIQMDRIRARESDPEAVDRFRTLWIPWEEAYHAAYSIRSIVDMVLET